MGEKCRCGGRIDYINKEERAYKDLGWCLECDLRYLRRNDKWKYISKAEFRRIYYMRMCNAS